MYHHQFETLGDKSPINQESIRNRTRWNETRTPR